MEAKVSLSGDVTVVVLTGYMDFETTLPFRRTCIDGLLNKRVIFDLRGLSFVGSSGLTGFVDVLREFKSKNALPVKFCGVSNEFRRLFWASELIDIEIYDDQRAAQASFTHAVAPSVVYVPSPRLEVDASDFEE